MSIKNKYSTSCCGSTNNAKTYDSTCCSSAPVSTPTPSCGPSDNIVTVPSVCFYPTCNVTATVDPFFLRFKNAGSNSIPLNATDVFLYHAVAGLLNIRAFESGSYQVSLVDENKAGSVIEEDDCVLVHVISSDLTNAALNTGVRCLDSTFLTPATDVSTTIFIFNGSGIPIGATLTFTYEGQTGSYRVDGFNAVSGNVYSYTVTNVGEGFLSGQIIDPGEGSNCTVPIVVQTEVDVCNLTTTSAIDDFTGCLNGSPRSFRPTADNQVIGSQSGGVNGRQWGRITLPETGCCFNIVGCLKFNAIDGCQAADTGVIDGTPPECFLNNFDVASGFSQTLAVNISGVKFYVIEYNTGTQEITLSPADPDSLFASQNFVEYDSPEVCFGSCCDSCGSSGTIYTNPVASNGLHTGTINNVPYAGTGLADRNPNRYLVGFQGGTNSGATARLDVDLAFNTPLAPGIGRPDVGDPTLIRQKICNNSIKGCTQILELEFFVEFTFNNLQEDQIINWEIGHYVASSVTLEDGTTPNPFNIVGRQTAEAGQLIGYDNTDPIIDNNPFLSNTSVGFGNANNTNKYAPYTARTVKDKVIVPACACVESWLWLYVEFLNGPAVTASSTDIFFRVRRDVTRHEFSTQTLEDVNFASEGFA